MHGSITFEKQSTQTLRFHLDAKQASLNWQQYSKPENIDLKLNGQITWQRTQPVVWKSNIQLGDSKAHIQYRQGNIQLQQLNIDMDALREQGVTFPVAWHGQLRGFIHLNDKQQPQKMHLVCKDFGYAKQHITGEARLQKQQWLIPELVWQMDKSRLVLHSDKHGHVHIQSPYLDARALTILTQSPLHGSGHLNIDELSMPFGTLNAFNGSYRFARQTLQLPSWKAVFYKGKLHGKNLKIQVKEQQLHLQGRIQAGGIRLNRWLWLHKQFDGYLEGSAYATTHLNASFDGNNQLQQWQARGDIMVYNAGWFLGDKHIQAKKFALSLNKKIELDAKLSITSQQQQYHGKLHIDEQKHISGYIQQGEQRYILSKTWPHPSYTIQP